MIKEPGVYKLKTEFFKENNISEMQYKRRKEDLLEWLKDFYNYEILEGKPLRIKIVEVYDEYRPLPRKISSSIFKQKDYEEYVKDNLPKDFKPESKSHMARKAIWDFGLRKYSHKSEKAVASRYVGPAMDRYGEKNDKYHWVDYLNYKPLGEELITKWKMILKEENINKDKMADAFVKNVQGENIKPEIDAYKRALSRMREETGVTPVRVVEWRIRKDYN